MSLSLLSLVGLSGVYFLQPEWSSPVLGPLGLSLPQKPQRMVKILVAEFEEPDSKNYYVTSYILNEIKQKTKNYKDVEIVPLKNHITEQQGKEVAHQMGMEQKADILIWGWYGATDEKAPVSVNFELLNKPDGLPELGDEVQGKVRTMAVTELKSFRIQVNLAHELTYLSLVTLGISRYAAKDWDGTIARLTNALESMKVRSEALDPSAIYFYRAAAYFFKGEKDWAIADLEQSLKINPNNAKAYNNLGVAYGSKGDKDQETTNYNKAIKVNPTYAEAYYNRGNTYYDKGGRDQAIADYTQALKIDPDNPKAYYNRGNVYRDKGDRDQAIADYNKALKINPSNAGNYFLRGSLYSSKGDKDKAIADYSQALKLNPNDAESYSNRGDSYNKKGDKDRAISDYGQALKINPRLLGPQRQ